MPETLASFRGAVRCERSTGGLMLNGATAESEGGEQIALILSAAATVECPAALEDAVVEHAGGDRYRIRCGTSEWLVEASAVHLHREIAGDFYRAIPPRRAPWRKRFFWRVVLALAASRSGLAALRMLRRQV